MITFQCYHPGYNTGQHMFVPASDECNRIHINIDTGSTTTTRFDHHDDQDAIDEDNGDDCDHDGDLLLRKWQIKTTQYTCESEMAPRKDCLQYHTAQYGRCQ